MKARAILLTGLCVAAVGAFADTTSANVFGLLKVTSSAAQTIVAVPWLECGGSGSTISASNVVKTAELTVGDQLYYYNGSSYDAWTLTESAGVKVWASVFSVAKPGKVTIAAASTVQSIARGGALILVRQSPASLGYFYLYGQVAGDTSVTTPITASSNGNPVYNLVAPPSVKDGGTIDINSTSDVEWANVGAADTIMLPVGGEAVECQRKDGAWKYLVRVQDGTIGTLPRYVDTWVAAPTIPTGTGFWYVSRTATAPTVTWRNVPSTGAAE